MTNVSYFPQKESSLKMWAEQFKNNLPTYANALNIGATEVTVLVTAAEHIADAVDAKSTARTNFTASVSANDTVIDDNEATLKEAIALLKKQPGYTDEIGKKLGVIAPNSPFDPTT